MKRMLSLTLAICMVMSFLPATAFNVGAAEDEDAALEYVFDNLYNDLPGDTVLSTITSYDMTNGGGWKYNSGSGRVNTSLMKNNRLEGDTRAVGQYIALDLNIPSDGEYTVGYTYFAFNGRGSKGDVYILPEGTSLDDVEAAKSSGVKIASVDYSTDGTSQKTEAECLVETVTLSKGNNILLFVVTDKGEKAVQNAARDYFTYPYSVTLTPLSASAPTEPSGVKHTYDFKGNKTLTEGDIKNIPSGKTPGGAFPGNDTDGWSAYSYSAGAEYIQANDGKNITFMQKSGEYLQVSIMNVGEWAALSIPVSKRGIYNGFITYKQLQGYGAADIYMIEAPSEELDEAGKRAYINEKLQDATRLASVNSHNVNNLIIKEAPEAAEFTFSSYADDSEYLLVIKTTSNKKILLDTLTLDGTGEIESAKSSYTYNFNTQVGIEGNSNPLKAKYSDTLDTWEGFASRNIHSIQAKSMMTNVAYKIDGGYIAFKFKLPSGGTYDATVGYYKHASYGDSGEVYILPADTKAEDIETSLSSGIKIADLDYYVKGSETAGNYVSEETEITLAKGEYIVVFNSTDASPDKNDGKCIRNYPGILTFTRKSGADIYTLDAETVLRGEGATTSLALFDLEGNEIDDFEILGIASSDESIATVSDTTVTAGNAAGRVKLSATVAVGGREIKAEGYVRVVFTAPSNAKVVADVDSRSENWINPGYLRDPSLYRSKDNALSDIGGFEAGDGISAEYTNGWSWYGDNADNHADNAFYQNNKTYLSFRMQDGEWAAIKMNFPNSGYYRTIINHRACAQSPYADIYFIPVPKDGESVSDYMTDDYRLGRLNCYNPDVPKWNAAGSEVSTYMGDAYVDEPGDYLLVVEMTGRAVTGNMYMYLNKFILSGANPIVSVGGSSNRAAMVGDTITLDKSMVTYEADIPEYKEKTTLAFKSLTPDIVTVTDDGVVTGISNGTGKIEITATYGEYSVSGEYAVVVGSGKTRRSYYTDEKVENAKRNIEKYDWAKSQRDTYVNAADVLIGYDVDTLYNLVTTQELPRASTLAYRFGDTGAYTCIYCDKDLTAEFGTYPWVMNVFTKPWKVQCPACKRLFPSNDFASFYKLGIDEKGNWDYELALQKHHEMFVCSNGENCACEAVAEERGSDAWREYYGYGKGYLKNNLYGEVGTTLGVASEEVDFWAVDDGWGYEYEYTTKSGLVETRCKPFIAYYNAWGLWEEAIPGAIEDLGMAYLYTDDIRYGRAGAILLDRVADVYPDFDTTELGAIFQVSDGNTITASGGTSRGRILGRLHDCNISQVMVPAYDALWPAYRDAWVINYLSEKAEMMNLDNPKTSAGAITGNIENNYLREINSSIHDYRISANFGVPEKLHITAAVVLDTMPETQEWVEFVFQSGKQSGYRVVTGGNVYAQLINVVDRDGHGNEASGGYNSGWVNNMLLIGEALEGYDKVTGYNLYENPKLRRMLMSEIDTLCASVWTPNVADNTHMGNQDIAALPQTLLDAYRIFDDDEERRELIVRTLYHRFRRSYDSIHGTIFEEDPDEITRATKKAVGEDLEVALPSRDLTGYGIAILRDGDWFISTDNSRNINTQRDFYIYYGQTDGHGHRDKLDLGFHAFGLDVGADLGVPRLKNSTDPQRFELAEHTLAHNTVMVNNLQQRVTLDGNPLHFDSTGMVQLMDVEAPEVYDWQGVEEYRRTLVMVDVDDDISYGVDFFRILGGHDHLYSFHALAREGELSDNVEIKKQTDENGNYIGSYQGEDKVWGSSNINSIDISNKFGGQYGLYDIDRDLGGTTDGLGTESWFGEVDRAVDPASVGVFSMDWQIVDNDRALNPANNDLGVKLTMVNSFKLDEITTSSVLPPQLEGAMDKARYLFARRTGEADGIKGQELDSLFTAVVEPYDGEDYISTVEPVVITRADGTDFEFDEAKAVKVTLKNGREDYIVYSKDNTVAYKVALREDTTFDFCGFVGVVSVKDGKVIYTYINDGTTIADKSELTSAYTGKVIGFEGDLSEENYIDVTLDSVPEDLSVFDGRYIYIENGLADNASYLIEDASAISGGVRLDIGDTTLITSYVDDYDFDKGYNYNIANGNTFRIPMSYVDDNAPVFDAVSDGLAASAGSSISVKVNAESPVCEEITYAAVRLPRGASFDETTATITWKPGSAQIGKNVVSIDATDASGRVTRQTFEIMVYGSTGGGFGGGGETSAPTTPSDEKENENENEKDSTTDVGEDIILPPAESNVRFTDLGNHAWAADAINALADEGIIKGTSETTFSPGNNITRADFAILLVRAFELSSENTENFSDVLDTDYFAKELAIARNTGIVNGIGDNKYAPRNTITRQDMMVIVYRAMVALSVSFADSSPGVRAEEYEDFDSVSDYAKEAVSALVGAGVVNGKNGKIAPTDYTTRAEVAVLIKRILDYSATK